MEDGRHTPDHQNASSPSSTASGSTSSVRDMAKMLAMSVFSRGKKRRHNNQLKDGPRGVMFYRFPSTAREDDRRKKWINNAKIGTAMGEKWISNGGKTRQLERIQVVAIACAQCARLLNMYKRSDLRSGTL